MISQTFDKLNDWALRHDYRGYLEHCISVQYLKRAKDIFSITYIIVSRYNIYETLYLIITGARTCYETTSDTKHLRTLHLCAGVYIYIYIWMCDGMPYFRRCRCASEQCDYPSSRCFTQVWVTSRSELRRRFRLKVHCNFAGTLAWERGSKHACCVCIRLEI